MNARYWMILLSIFGAGVGMPMFMAYQLKLGEFAKSPQTVHLNLGGSIPVAGGRAKIWFSEIAMGPAIQISCSKEQAMLEVREDERTEVVCGIQVKLLKLGENQIRGRSLPYVDLQVTWDDK